MRLSVRVAVCISGCLCVYVSGCMDVCLSVWLSGSLYVCVPVCLANNQKQYVCAVQYALKYNSHEVNELSQEPENRPFVTQIGSKSVSKR